MNITFAELQQRAEEARDRCTRLDAERHRLSLTVQQARVALTSAQNAGDVDAIHSAAAQVREAERNLAPIAEALQGATGTLRAINEQLAQADNAAKWRTYFESVAALAQRATAEREEFERVFALICRRLNEGIEQLADLEAKRAATAREFEQAVLSACPTLGGRYPSSATCNADELKRQELDSLADWFRGELEKAGATREGIAAALGTPQPFAPGRLAAMRSTSDPTFPYPLAPFAPEIARLLDERRAAIVEQKQREVRRSEMEQLNAEVQRQAQLERASIYSFEANRALTEKLAREGKLAIVGGVRVEESPEVAPSSSTGMDALERATGKW